MGCGNCKTKNAEQQQQQQQQRQLAIEQQKKNDCQDIVTIIQRTIPDYFKQNPRNGIVLLEACLKQQQETLGEINECVFYTMECLADTYHAIGNFTKALFITRNLYAKEKIWVEQHRTMMRPSDWKSDVQHRLSTRPTDYESDVQRRRENISPASTLAMKILITEHNLALYMSKTGNHTQAFTFTTLCFEKWKGILGYDHIDVLLFQHNLVYYLFQMARYTEATDMCRKCWTIEKRVLGENHKQTLNSQYDLGRCLACLEQNSEAIAILKDCLRRQEERLGKVHPICLAISNDILFLTTRFCVEHVVIS